MRLVDVTIDADGFPRTIGIASHTSASSENWVTVLTGENGTRKSLLLRLIAGAALGKERFSSRGHRTANARVQLVPANPEVHVYALSGTPNDRFPVMAGIPVDRTPTSFDQERYFYFGPSYAGGLATTHRAVSILAHSLLLNTQRTMERWASVSAILRHMHFNPFIGVRLVPLKSKRSRDQTHDDESRSSATTLRERANLIDTRLSSQEGTRYTSLRNYVAGLLVDGPHYDMAQTLASESHRLNFDFAEPPWGGLHVLGYTGAPDHFPNLIAMGALRVEEIWLLAENVPRDAPKPSERISNDDLSSGQWQLLTGLLNLALMIEDDSLVLVDEPENSLHPQWQRDYVELLSAAMGQSKGCHALIATHSPLIAAGVEAKSGNLISVRKVDGNTISFEEDRPVYAWRPDDVLKERFEMDSVRPPELIRMADRLLSIVSSTEDAPAGPEERLLLAERLEQMSAGLPSGDPLVPAITALIDMARGRTDLNSRPQN